MSEVIKFKQQIKELEENLNTIMREIPVGNIKAHTVENAADFVSYYVSETARLTIKLEEIEDENEKLITQRDALLAVVECWREWERRDGVSSEWLCVFEKYGYDPHIYNPIGFLNMLTDKALAL